MTTLTEPQGHDPLPTQAGLYDGASYQPQAKLPAEAMDAMDQGLLSLDWELRIDGCNAAYRRLLDLPQATDYIGRPYRDLLNHLIARGEFFIDDQQGFLDERLHALVQREAFAFERVRPNGKALLVKGTPLPSGGIILTYLDVTEARRARMMLQRNAKATVTAMANFAEHRDTDTGVHVLRVARLVGQTARKLLASGRYPALDEEFIEQVGTASILHDVGKIATPDRILLKNGALTKDEREIMMRHAADGAHLLRQASLAMGQSAYLDLGAEIALSHHEWFDGTGYPQGLAGDDIPLSGKICAVADVFDALTSRRPYKAPWEQERAVDLLHKRCGSQFDPDVVEAFIAFLEEREQVSIVQWRDAFSVGDLHIDEQHSILIDTINQLASAESLRNHNAVLMIIDELASYAAFHFDYEERLMERVGYPQLDGHKQIHQAFVTWVAKLRDEYLTYGRRPLGPRVLDYLSDWLSQHILGEDQRYKDYL
ncbi:bacteriohemerythrin [Magnetovirga frankeli]|uniref:bacteriohemerythrin n=1 Tax=Magnetovirga frankeli TaxID=947516 RepID=UPI00129345FD|nr:bacteriohemerythrin [gamma proteobacterium SS-5]